MNKQISKAVLTACLGHICLLLAVLADFFRRSVSGAWPVLLGVLGLLALLIAGIVFVRRPNLFFFYMGKRSTRLQKTTMPLRMISWVIVVVTPVIYLIGAVQLSAEISLSLGMRLIAGYIFFAWVALALNLSVHLFGSFRSMDPGE